MGAPGLPDLQTPVSVEGMDLSIGIHPAIRELLFDVRWQQAREVASARRAEFASSGYQLNGLLVSVCPLAWRDLLHPFCRGGAARLVT
jgi:hypothetical protein